MCVLCPAMERCPAHAGFLPCARRRQDRLRLPVTLNQNKQVAIRLLYLFLLIFFKYMYSSHAFQCLTLEVFGAFIKEFGDVFVTRNILWEINSCIYQLACDKIDFVMFLT